MAKKETAGITKKLTKSLMKTGKHTTENWQIMCHPNDNRFLFKENKERGENAKGSISMACWGKQSERKTNGIREFSRVSMYGEHTNN